MKKRDLIDMHNKELKDLKTKAMDLRKSITDTRFELKLGRVSNPHVLKFMKRDLAQVLTLLKIKEMNQQVTPKKNIKTKGVKNGSN